MEILLDLLKIKFILMYLEKLIPMHIASNHYTIYK